MFKVTNKDTKTTPPASHEEQINLLHLQKNTDAYITEQIQTKKTNSVRQL